MLTRAQKEDQVADLREKIAKASCVYLADYRGLDVESANDLRKRIRSSGEGDFEYRVMKNCVLRRAVGETGVEGIAAHLQGPTAIALSYGDPVGLAKVLADFAKDHEVFSLKGGLLEGDAVDAADIARLATLPSLDQLRAKIVGLIQAPATKLVRLFAEPGAQHAGGRKAKPSFRRRARWARRPRGEGVRPRNQPLRRTSSSRTARAEIGRTMKKDS